MLEDFRAFLLVDEAKAPITVEKRLGLLASAVERGLDVKRFSESREHARAEGRRYLALRRYSATVHAYNSDVKVLNDLARFRAFVEDRRSLFRKLPEPRLQPKALADAAVRRLLAFEGEDEESQRFARAVLLWALKSAMRASEIAAMTLADLDAERGRFYVRKPAKGGKRRWLPIERWVFSPKRSFGAYLRWRASVADQLPEGQRDALWVTTRTGRGHSRPRRVSPSYLRQLLGRVGHQVGVKVNLTITRHTRATELRRRGWDLLYIREYLGHRSVKSTEVYAELGEGDVHEMMRRRPGIDPYQSTENDEP